MSIANTQTETIIQAGIIDDNDQVLARVEHLKELENLVGNSYPNKYERSNVTGKEDTISNIHDFSPVMELVKQLKDNTPEGEKPDQEFKAQLNEKLKEFGNVRVSGRLAVPPRVMGKAAFVHLSDGINRLQIYVRKQDAKVISNDSGKAVEGEETAWEVFKLLDHGDFVGAEGFLFLTNTGELSVHVETFQFLSKALMPMPDKMHGIADPELQRRYRYADLIASSLQIEHEGLTTRQVFERRAKLISGMRRFLDDVGYIEVETPMLTPKATGAAATPFETHHNALDIPLYARIAPELYLKRLTVGGFEKVYELNRNFRNEGLSHKHNPEFTMLEFYCAYMDVNGMMDFAEEMLKESVQKATGGSLQVKYRDNPVDFIDFSKFQRLSMKNSILKYVPAEFERLTTEKFEHSYLDNPTMLLAISKLFKYGQGVVVVPNKPTALTGIFQDFKNYDEFSEYVKEKTGREYTDKGDGGLLITWFWKNIILPIASEKKVENNDENNIRLVVDIFENAVESHLIQPTFIIDYPKSISPLSKASPDNPQIAERFELFINGMEVANGFSELNDPQEQFERFVDQMKERETGDAEAMVLDEDYIRALAYGMPPAAGIGIGIDRLVMLLTNKHSIRDVILFPHMRPLLREEEKGSEGEK
jgi:lysyl-tRNA synthetase, class II